jgi:hypothetical protein
MKLKRTMLTPHNSSRTTLKIITALLAILILPSQISTGASAAASTQSKPRYVNFDSTAGTGCFKWTDQLVASEPNLSPRMPSYLGKKATKVPCTDGHHFETFVNFNESKYSQLGKSISTVTKYCQKVFGSKKKTPGYAQGDLQVFYSKSTKNFLCTIVGSSYTDDANTAYRVYKESVTPILRINIGK